MSTPPLHRLPAGLKLGALAGAGTAAFGVTDPAILAPGVLGCLALAAFARVPWPDLLKAWRAAVPVLALVLLAQGLGGDWMAGLAALLRLSGLILLATLVSLTTRQSDITAALATGLRPLRHLGLDPEALALGVSLALRFLPLIAAEAALVRDAQRARGLERSPLALFVPLMVRVLKMADAVAEAIEARGGRD